MWPGQGSKYCDKKSLLRAMKSNPDSVELMEMFNHISIDQKLFSSERQINLDQISQGRCCVYILSENDLLTERSVGLEQSVKALEANGVVSDAPDCLVYLTKDYSPLAEIDLKNNLLFKLIM